MRQRQTQSLSCRRIDARDKCDFAVLLNPRRDDRRGIDRDGRSRRRIDDGLTHSDRLGLSLGFTTTKWSGNKKPEQRSEENNSMTHS